MRRNIASRETKFKRHVSRASIAPACILWRVSRKVWQLKVADRESGHFTWGGILPNRNLTADELVKANALLAEVRSRLVDLAGGDQALLFAYRRKISKELVYDERGKPMHRNKLKAQTFGEQGGKCTECGEPLPSKYTVLDRKIASDGYTPENTELIHQECDRKRQSAKQYK